MTVDAVGSQLRCVRERFPTSRLKGYPPEAPLELEEVQDFVLAQYCPDAQRVFFWIAISLLFGRRLAPVGFPRYPAFVVNLVAVFFSKGKQHCVDDQLKVEREETYDLAHDIWMRFCK